MIDGATANTRKLIGDIDSLLDIDAPSYSMPREILEAIRILLNTETNMITQLFAENQRIMKHIEELVEKHTKE